MNQFVEVSPGHRKHERITSNCEAVERRLLVKKNLLMFSIMRIKQNIHLYKSTICFLTGGEEVAAVSFLIFYDNSGKKVSLESL